MKNKRIWLVIVCILVVGVLVTRYTSSVVNREEPSQEMAAGGAEMRMAEVEACLLYTSGQHDRTGRQAVSGSRAAGDGADGDGR